MRTKQCDLCLARSIRRAEAEGLGRDGARGAALDGVRVDGLRLEVAEADEVHVVDAPALGDVLVRDSLYLHLTVAIGGSAWLALSGDSKVT